jgi:hypothetical protein
MPETHGLGVDHRTIAIRQGPDAAPLPSLHMTDIRALSSRTIPVRSHPLQPADLSGVREQLTHLARH